MVMSSSTLSQQPCVDKPMCYSAEVCLRAVRIISPRKGFLEHIWTFLRIVAAQRHALLPSVLMSTVLNVFVAFLDVMLLPRHKSHCPIDEYFSIVCPIGGDVVVPMCWC